MSLLNSTLQTLVVRLRDMSGHITNQKLHNRIFDAYEAKSLVFEALTPQHQMVMNQFRGQVPPQHPVGPPVLIENWQGLMEVHNEQNIYQLMPRRAKTNAAYLVMSAVCASNGSPFTMESRLDPIDYKFMFKAADQEFKNQFNAKNPDKVRDSIWFDGLMKSENDSALVMCHHAVSPANLNTIVGTHTFLKQWSQEPADGDRHRDLKKAWGDLLKLRTHVFCGCVTPPNRELLNYAKSKGIFIYAKKGLRYEFQP